MLKFFNFLKEFNLSFLTRTIYYSSGKTLVKNCHFSKLPIKKLIWSYNISK